MIVSPILTSLRDHPLLRRLCVRGPVVDLTGLETLLLSDNSKITELEIDRLNGNVPMVRLTPVLHALARRPTLTKLGLRYCALGRDDVRQLVIVLRNTPSLQTLVLKNMTLGSTELAELAPALYRNTSIKDLDISYNGLAGMDSAEIVRDILRSNKTMTAFNFSVNEFGDTTGAVDCIADGLGSNSTLLKIDLSSCALGDDGVSTLAQTLGSRNTTLQKLVLDWNSITSTGVGVLLETSFHITDLDLRNNPIGNEGASLLARALGNNALPNLTRLSLCGVRDDGFIALVSALQQNTSLIHLNLREHHVASERVFLALAESLPEIKTLRRLDLT
jgi:Ran GTPase-activating protein (RanGAP) involved in mRNA processing and transport